ncbi:MAG: ankyrin repeat domain-containing protein [Gammaproteobacteria bacterium]
MWQMVIDNPYHVTEDKLIQQKIPLPGDILSNAVAFGYTDLVIKLLQNSEYVKMYGADALTMAAAMGRIQMSRVLIGGGISPNAQNNLGNTALWAATQFGCTDEVEFLIKRGANVNFDVKRDHNTPMISAIWDRHYQTAAVLLKDGYKVKPWELSKIKVMLFRQDNPSVWNFLFSKLEKKSKSSSKANDAIHNRRE